MKWTELYHEIAAIKEIIGLSIVVIISLLVMGAMAIDMIRDKFKR